MQCAVPIEGIIGQQYISRIDFVPWNCINPQWTLDKGLTKGRVTKQGSCQSPCLKPVSDSLLFICLGANTHQLSTRLSLRLLASHRA